MGLLFGGGGGGERTLHTLPLYLRCENIFIMVANIFIRKYFNGSSTGIDLSRPRVGGRLTL